MPLFVARTEAAPPASSASLSGAPPLPRAGHVRSHHPRVSFLARRARRHRARLPFAPATPASDRALTRQVRPQNALAPPARAGESAAARKRACPSAHHRLRRAACARQPGAPASCGCSALFVLPVGVPMQPRSAPPRLDTTTARRLIFISIALGRCSSESARQRCAEGAKASMPPAAHAQFTHTGDADHRSG